MELPTSLEKVEIDVYGLIFFSSSKDKTDIYYCIEAHLTEDHLTYWKLTNYRKFT